MAMIMSTVYGSLGLHFKEGGARDAEALRIASISLSLMDQSRLWIMCQAWTP